MASKNESVFHNLVPLLSGKRSLLVWAAAFLICLVVVLFYGNSKNHLTGQIEEFEAGKVADRDVIAEFSISYVDEQATRLRMESQERLIPAVFHYSNRATDELKARWNHFMAFAENPPVEVHSMQAYTHAIQAEFPGDFPDDALGLLYNSEARQEVLKDCSTVLEVMLKRGIYSMPQTGLERLNPDVVELISYTGTRIEQERVPFWSIVTRSEADEAVKTYVATYPPEVALLATDLIMPFLKANVFYSPDDTARRIDETRSAIEPVMRTIERGKQIIRKGFIISEEDMIELRALRMTLTESSLPMIFADLLFLILIFGILVFFSGSRIVDRKLADRETYLVSGLSTLYIAGSALISDLPLDLMPVSVVVPTALIIMLPSILIHARLALMLAVVLPLGAFITGSFNAPAFFFALISGVVAAYSLQAAEKRMDLVKAGLVIAAANIVVMTAVLLWQRADAGVYIQSLFWAAFNGIASGMLVLGFLPPLEHALNAATTFRLIELSDLNSPVLKRLFTAAPGTYSHSIMVANLAESACQDIGANSILARVGAYYHDLGKIENPGYFVENQDGINPHDEMNPRLSATVIRSHVKLGVEKARQLRLPEKVIDIIAEHHGNSVISWFYSKALNQEDPRKDPVNREDYCYPGQPPRSRESAVVMLADVTEAAVRSMKKHSVAKIKKFIQELIQKKVEHGQLAHSELTFRDLETIKNAFVRVLAGYYHSRIEYPKIEAQNESGDAPVSEDKEDVEE